MSALDHEPVSSGGDSQPATDVITAPPAGGANPTPVTREQVRHVAALASLELTPAEEERMERDLNAILGYVAELNQLDTSHVEPMAQVSEVLAGTKHSNPEPASGAQTALAASLTLDPTLRPDEPRPSLPRATVMAQAPATDGAFFKVPKVIER